MKYTILGYLSSAPGSGYDLVQQLGGGLGWFWAASHSQIYPELRRLESAGLITGAATTVGERLEKRVYSLTEAGLQDLLDWTRQKPEYRPSRDPERLQLLFSDNNDVETIRQHLQAHLDHFTERRDQVIDMRERILTGKHPRIQQRLKKKDAAERAKALLLCDLAYSGDVRRAELEISWATEALARLDGLAGSEA
ncbi:MAG: PadR family transcriptional regulator [Candidatus Leucobacter sulfamidivorax]|nr:PadR family transcriptional regulator [Candidatus Leucobacter sulfamidivorax]